MKRCTLLNYFLKNCTHKELSVIGNVPFSELERVVAELKIRGFLNQDFQLAERHLGSSECEKWNATTKIPSNNNFDSNSGDTILESPFQLTDDLRGYKGKLPSILYKTQITKEVEPVFSSINSKSELATKLSQDEVSDLLDKQIPIEITTKKTDISDNFPSLELRNAEFSTEPNDEL